MDRIIKIESVAQFNDERGQRTLHPLVSVLDQSQSKPIREARYLSDLYIIFLKEGKSGELRYGRNHYDYQDGTLLFIAGRLGTLFSSGSYPGNIPEQAHPRLQFLFL
jgi:AraC family transcriptional activator of pobA